MDNRMADAAEENLHLVQIQQEYFNFLDEMDADEDGLFGNCIKDMIKDGKQRLMVNFNHLREMNPVRCKAMLSNGFQELPLFQRALKEMIVKIDENYAKEHEEFFIGLKGSFGANHVTPRSLAAIYLGNTVCVEGIVTKCSLINPKVVRSFHYCPATKKTLQRQYNDLSSFDSLPTVNVYPSKDEDGNLLETEFGLSRYRDHQTITIQEMPEKAPTGQLPRSLDIILDNDLVDSCKPGDRILVVGVYRCLPSKQGGFTTGVFKSILLANNVIVMHKDINAGIRDASEIAVIRRFSRTPNVFSILAKSLAPSIHGHEYIKKALLCLLLGGVEKTLANGTRLRGDINVLLIGDPSVAKSQMLRYISNVAPRVVMTTGRGSSGVGLTAAITMDHETGERRLEAGAMVLADRGIVCIDEFDKMTDADRTAIHEVMEQGKVTIAKAGIHARLNARTSVLAAANPLYGRYDTYKTPMDNIGLQDSLLSRFDLLFIVKDTPNADTDSLIAEHVLRMHRYRNPGERDGEPTPLNVTETILATIDPEEAVEKRKLEIYETHNPLLHGKFRTRRDKLLSMEFIKKYITFAKTSLPSPKMTEEASKIIAEKYTTLRSEMTNDDKLKKTQPITARCLETMIRLASAHAKARFSERVTKEDALSAIELVEFAIFEKVESRKKKRKNPDDYNDHSDGDNDDDENGEDGHDNNGDAGSDVENHRSKRARSNEQTNGSTVEQPMEVEAEEIAEISDSRYTRFKIAISELYELEREQALAIPKIIDWLTDPQRGFTSSEVKGGIARLEAESVLMTSEGVAVLCI